MYIYSYIPIIVFIFISYEILNTEIDRNYFLLLLKKIINPIINDFCNNDYAVNKLNLSIFEAFARSFNGISLWLNLSNITNLYEKKYQKNIKTKIVESINCIFSDNIKRVKFSTNIQYVVEAAFFAQALLRSFNSIWIYLKENIKSNIINEMKSTRCFKINQNNWILFSAMIELFIYKTENRSNIFLIKRNYNVYMNWYMGDGWYGDGKFFHFDYYNSYVIQPFILELSLIISQLKIFYVNVELVIKRYKRYVIILERLINPDGTYPIIGRSITYRFGAFTPLVLSVYYNIVPTGLSEGQIKRGVKKVLKKTMEYPIFDKNGYLIKGFVCNLQFNLAEDYISFGSTYLCTFIFSALGISENNNFWKNNELITSEKVWNMHKVLLDKSID